MLQEFASSQILQKAFTPVATPHISGPVSSTHLTIMSHPPAQRRPLLLPTNAGQYHESCREKPLSCSRAPSLHPASAYHSSSRSYARPSQRTRLSTHSAIRATSCTAMPSRPCTTTRRSTRATIYRYRPTPAPTPSWAPSSRPRATPSRTPRCATSCSIFEPTLKS